MSNKVISFEIGSQVIKICVVSFRKKNPKVYQTLILETPYDCVEDGYIKDMNTLTTVIGKKLKEANISVGHAVFTISSTKIANREVILPMVKEKKIAEIIKANTADYFPIDVKDYNITYIIMEKIITKEVKNYRLLVLAVHNNLLTNYYELAERLKLKVDSIDYVGNSVYQVYQKLITQGTNMIVQINEQNTMVNVLQKNVLELQRIIPYGFDTAINSILDQPYYKINKAEEAFILLRDKPLIRPRFAGIEQQYEEEEILTITQSEEPVEEITNSLRHLVNNILRVVDYYSSKNQNNKIKTIFITGLGAKLNGLEQLLANEIGIEVKVIGQLHGVTFTQPITIENFSESDFIACAGATIAPVGMIPSKYAIRETQKSNLVSVATITSLAAVTTILLWLLSNNAVNDAEKEKAVLSSQIMAMESIDAIYSENLRMIEELTTIKSLEDLCYSNNEVLVPLIKELELKLPSNVIVHSMTAGASGVVMNLSANSKESAAMTLIQLKSIGYLTEVTTAGINDQKDEYGISEVSFSVIATYAKPDQTEEAE